MNRCLNDNLDSRYEKFGTCKKYGSNYIDSKRIACKECLDFMDSKLFPSKGTIKEMEEECCRNRNILYLVIIIACVIITMNGFDSTIKIDSVSNSVDIMDLSSKPPIKKIYKNLIKLCNIRFKDLKIKTK